MLAAGASPGSVTPLGAAVARRRGRVSQGIPVVRREQV